MSEGTRLDLGGREAERRSGQQGITGADTDQLGTELLALLEEYGMEPMKPDTIVLIHGFWVTPRSWENW